jgi:hypothetical protein
MEFETETPFVCEPKMIPVSARWGNEDQSAVVLTCEDGIVYLVSPDHQKLVGVTIDEFIPHAPSVPPSITNFQARAVLMSLPGSSPDRTLFDDINEVLKSEGGFAWQAWEQANEFTRNGLLVNDMGERFGLTQEELDQMFIQGARIEA